MIPNKGLWLDGNEINQPPNTWRYMLNGFKSSELGMPENESGTTAINSALPSGNTLIGYTVIDKTIIVFSVNSYGFNNGEIGTIGEDGTYTRILKDDVLNFQLQYPIKAIGRKNSKGEREILWIDDINPPRILNIDVLPFSVDGNKAFTTPTDVVLLKLFPEFNTLNIVDQDIEIGGSLNSGVIFPIFKYVGTNGSMTNWINLSRPYYITDSGFGNVADYDGVEGAQKTDKQLTLYLENIDTNFDKLIVGAICVNNDITTVKELYDIKISGTSMTVSINNTDEGDVVSLEDLLIPSASYNNAKDLLELNDELLLANLKENSNLNYQKYANNILINYTSTLQSGLDGYTNVDDYQKGRRIPKSFLHGEVYAFYIVFIMKDGTYSKAFHIPGRALDPGIPATSLSNKDTSTYSSTINIGRNVLVYEIEDTCDGVNTVPNLEFTSSSGTNTVISSGTGKIPPMSLGDRLIINGNATAGNDGLYVITSVNIVGASYDLKKLTGSNPVNQAPSSTEVNPASNMGFWENMNEIYPNTDDFNSSTIDGGDLRGTNVRHHRFPSISHMKNTLYASEPTYGSTSMDILGIDVSNVVVPQEIADQVQGFFICYADRTVDNMTVLGQSIMIYGGESGNASFLPNKKIASTANWNTPNAGTSAASSDINPKTDVLRFHAFDLLYNKPQISPTYIQNLLTLDVSVSTSGSGGIMPDSQMFQFANDKRRGFIDHTEATPAIPATDKIYRKVTKDRYIPNNVIDGETDNVSGEEHLELELETTLGVTSIPDMNANPAAHYSYLTNLCLIKEDIYNRFYDSRKLVICSATDFISNTPEQTFKDNNQVLGGGTDIAVIYTSPSTTQIFPSVDGVYTVEVRITISGSGSPPSGPQDISLFKNGSLFVLLGSPTTDGSYVYTVTGVVLSSTDYLEVTVDDPDTSLTVTMDGWIKLTKDSTVGDSYSNYKPVTTATTYTYNYIHGGDITVNLRSLLTTSRIDPEITPDQSDGLGTMIVHRFLCESVSIIDLRYESTDSQSKYYPKTSDLDGVLFENYNVGEDRVLLYNKDYSSLSKINYLQPFNTFDEVTIDHPYRIIRSRKIAREAESSWINFLPNDYYEMPKLKGEIIGINNLDNRLVIRHEKTLYITIVKQKMETDQLEVKLGDTDIFDSEPQEIITVDGGFIGSRSKFSSITTQYGLIIVDEDSGKVFILNKQLTDLSILGVKEYFRKNLKLNRNILTVPLSTGVTYSNNAGVLRITINTTTLAGLTESFFQVGDMFWIASKFSFAEITATSTSGSNILIDTDYVWDTAPTSVEYRKEITNDNPYHAHGVITTIDPTNDRILITKKDYESNAYYSSLYKGEFKNITSFKSTLSSGDLVLYDNEIREIDNTAGTPATDLFVTTIQEDKVNKNNFTLSYYPKSNIWYSFHSYSPLFYVLTKDKFISCINNILYNHNNIVRCSFYGTSYEFYTKIIISDNFDISKLFTNINWISRVINYTTPSSNLTIQKSVTFNTIRIEAEDFDTGEITLTPFGTITTPGNTRNIRGSWQFNKVRDSTDNRKLVDKFAKVTFKFTPTTKSISIHEVNSNYRSLQR